MPPEMTVVIDGIVYPVGRFDWVLWGPCGCPQGVMVASIAPTETDAWTEFYDDDPARVTSARTAGFRLELMRHERYAAEVLPGMVADCPHGQAGGQLELFPGGAS